MQFTSKRLILVFLVTLVWLAIPNAVLADDGGDYYLRFSAITDDIGGDFDGVSYYEFENSDIETPVPSLDQANGYKFTFGKIENRLAGEISYLESTHDTLYHTILGPVSLGDCLHRRLSFDARYFFSSPQKTGLIPFCQLGIFSDMYRVDLGAYSKTEFGSATYTGSGFNLGLGALWRMNDHLGLELSYLMSHLEISRIHGLGQTRKPEDNFSATSQELNLGLNYYF